MESLPELLFLIEHEDEDSSIRRLILRETPELLALSRAYMGSDKCPVALAKFSALVERVMDEIRVLREKHYSSYYEV